MFVWVSSKGVLISKTTYTCVPVELCMECEVILHVENKNVASLTHVAKADFRELFQIYTDTK